MEWGTDKGFMIRILGNLSEKYESKVKLLEKNLNHEDNSLTLDFIMADLDTQYKKICKNNNQDPENEDENKRKKQNSSNATALVMSIYKGFKGRYYVCGNWGHREEHSPLRKKQRTAKMSQIRHQQTILQIQIIL